MTHFLDDHCAYLSPNARSDCNKLDINEVIQHILISASFLSSKMILLFIHVVTHTGSDHFHCSVMFHCVNVTVYAFTP